MPKWDVGKGTTNESYKAGRTGDHRTHARTHANEFTGVTSKPFDSSKYKKAKNEQFYKAAEIPNFYTPVGAFFTSTLKKGAEADRRFFADPNHKTLITKTSKKSVIDAGKYKPLSVTKSNVKGYKSKALTQSDFESMSASQKEATYKDYTKLRSEGKIDAYGNTHPNYRREFIVHTNKDGTKEYRETYMKSGADDDGGSSRANVVTTKNVGGKSILTTEGKVAEDKTSTKEYDERITKKKGRRKNIRTSATGVTKTSADYSLGKKSLLGQVV